ncbi:MAG: hypothetical protein FJ041_07655 [Candidatus Cloacimonetes bacterium]|nr:hypothetical protein [Candidatus Cloacimonadota bacterium]
MNQYLSILAKELARRLNEVINLPFLSEEEEELFFQLVVTKVLEISLGHILEYVNRDNQTAE